LGDYPAALVSALSSIFALENGEDLQAIAALLQALSRHVMLM